MNSAESSGSEESTEDATQHGSANLSEDIKESKNPIKSTLLDVSKHVGQGDDGIEMASTDSGSEHNGHEHAQEQSDVIVGPIVSPKEPCIGIIFVYLVSYTLFLT